MSVVMPARNVERFLNHSVESILRQSMPDFELIIVDDASTDGTRTLAHAWAGREERIRVVCSETNLGLVAASNLAVECALAPVIARMDADDLAAPVRLESQLALLTADVSLVASVFCQMDEGGRVIHPPQWARLRGRGDRAPFSHSSVMFRRELFRSMGGYRQECVYFEDQDLYWRLAEHGRIVVQTVPMVTQRTLPTNSRNRDNLDEFLQQMTKMLAACQAWKMGGRQSYENAVRAKYTASATPELLYWRCSGAVWSGERNPMLRLLAEYRAFPRNGKELAVWILALLGGLHPRLPQLALRAWVAGNNSLSKPQLGPVVDWYFSWSSPPAKESIAPLRSDVP